MAGEVGPGQGPRTEDTSLIPKRARIGSGDLHTEGSLPPQAASGQ